MAKNMADKTPQLTKLSQSLIVEGGKKTILDGGKMVALKACHEAGGAYAKQTFTKTISSRTTYATAALFTIGELTIYTW
jgi:hypothetical protein